MAKVPKDASPLAFKGEHAVTAGELGLGKSISSNTTGVPDMFMLGKASTDGKDTPLTNDKKPIAPWCRNTGPTP